MSKNFNNPLKYKGYLKNPLTVNEIDARYQKERVRAVRVDLYSDFVQYLSDTVFMTYMGDNHHINSYDKIQHFKWCWDKTLKTYEDLGYKIIDVDVIFIYFESFFCDVFYFVDDKDKFLEDSIKNVWDFIFDYNVVKSAYDVTNFLDIYIMFEKSLWDK